MAGNAAGDVVTTKVVELTTVLEYTGEDAIEDVEELILRGCGLSDFNPDVARRLSSLRVLSLSHNLMSSLEQFAHFENLLELNLNFNQITSLQQLKCPRLEKLFLSHNRVSNVEPLYGMTNLTTLCLYHNSLLDVSAALAVLRTLPKLRELDMAGNPCAKRSAAHHEIVMQLPRLRQLDGEAVTALDKDLASMYFAKAERKAKAATGDRARPSTAPSGGARLATPNVLVKEAQLFRSSELNNNPTLLKYLAHTTLHGAFDEPSGAASGAAPASGTGTATSADDSARASGAQAAATISATASEGGRRSKQLRRKHSGSRLLPRAQGLPRPRSLRRLGTDASLQLASDRPPLPSPSAAAAGAAAPLPVSGVPAGMVPAAGGGSSAVGRLRGIRRRSRPDSTGSAGSAMSAGSMGSMGSLSSADGDRRSPSPSSGVDDSGSGTAAQAPTRTSSKRRKPPRPAPTATASTASSPVDLSDPHVTIRKLLKTVEVLQSERAHLQKTLSNLTAGMSDTNAGADSASALAQAGISWEDLVRDNQELRAENANMYILKEENEALRAKIRKLHREVDASRVHAENKQLKADVRELRERLRRAELQSRGRPSTAASSSPLLAAAMVPMQRPQTPAEVIAECQDVDQELADLIARNEESLAGLKRDLQVTKAAWGVSDTPTTPPRGAQRVAPPSKAATTKQSPRASLAGRTYRVASSPMGAGGGGVAQQRRSRAAVSVAPGAGVGAGAGARPPSRAGSGRPSSAAGPTTVASTDPSSFLVRPGTPNLLGREIKSAADVEAAYAAVAAAQAARAELATAREALLSAAGRSKRTSDSKTHGEGQGDDDDDCGGRTSSYSHGGGVDRMVLHDEGDSSSASDDEDDDDGNLEYSDDFDT